MEKLTRRIFAAFVVSMLGTWSVLQAADPPPSATNRDATADDKADNITAPPNLLIIGASSLNSPVGQTQLLGAMLESTNIQMNIEGKYPQLDEISEILGTKVWNYVIMDAWHLGRASADGSEGNASVPPDFPKAVADFVKQVRAHSPKCKIILFAWWIPHGPTANNEGVMRVFHRCAEQAKLNNIWVATTGPAFMEACLERRGLHITKSETDAHPGIHGAYLNACSLFAIVADKSPVGLPAKLSLQRSGGKKEDYSLEAGDAKYLQELAWKVYQRENKYTKPAK